MIAGWQKLYGMRCTLMQGRSSLYPRSLRRDGRMVNSGFYGATAVLPVALPWATDSVCSEAKRKDKIGLSKLTIN